MQLQRLMHHRHWIRKITFDRTFTLESAGSLVNSSGGETIRRSLLSSQKILFLAQRGTTWSRRFCSLPADDITGSRPLCDALPGFSTTTDYDTNAVDTKLPPRKVERKPKKATTKKEFSSRHSGHVCGVCERNLGSLRGEIASRLETSAALSKWWLNTNRNQSGLHGSSKQVISTAGQHSWCLRGLALA